MRQSRILCDLLLLILATGVRANAQRPTVAPYSLNVSVDEVSLSFHAEDAHGLPVNDLKLDELKIFDNGKPPSRVVVFQPLRDFPIRAGILMDTSESM
jgi:hypothetical protein